MNNNLFIGYYEVLGNTVEYEGGNTGWDMDSREEIPVTLIIMHGVYIAERI